MLTKWSSTLGDGGKLDGERGEEEKAQNPLLAPEHEGPALEGEDEEGQFLEKWWWWWWGQLPTNSSTDRRNGKGEEEEGYEHEDIVTLLPDLGKFLCSPPAHGQMLAWKWIAAVESSPPYTKNQSLKSGGSLERQIRRLVITRVSSFVVVQI